MNIKNMNLVEQHVEKATLLVAAAGTAYLLYMALLQPTTIDVVQPPLSGEQVEGKVTEVVQRLDQERAKTAKLVDPNSISLHGEYVPRYKRLRNQPLPQSLLVGTIPQFAPLNVPVGGVGPPPPPPSQVIVIPVVPAPIDLTAAAYRSVVLPPPPAAATPGAPPVAPPAAAAIKAALPDKMDLNWVDIVGDFPLLDYRASMINYGGKPENALPAYAQRVNFNKVQVQRREKSNDVWTEWEDVPPTRLVQNFNLNLTESTSKENVLLALDMLNQHWKDILLPPFYLNAADGKPIVPTLSAHTLSETDAAEQKNKVDAIQTYLNRPGAASPPAGPGGMGGPPPGYNGPPPGYGGPPPEAPPSSLTGATTQPTAAAPVAPADLNTLLSMPVVPFWFHDETVRPEHVYQYRVRISMFNPVFRLDKAFGLKDEEARNQPWLYSAWTNVPGTVLVKANQYFFFMSQIGAATSREASVKIFKWTGGRWFVYDESEQPGTSIGAHRKVMGIPEGVDFTTGYVLVDVVAGTDDTTVIVLSPDGELVHRSVRRDSLDPLRRELEPQVYRPGLIPTTPKIKTGPAGPSPAPAER